MSAAYQAADAAQLAHDSGIATFMGLPHTLLALARLGTNVQRRPN